MTEYLYRFLVTPWKKMIASNTGQALICIVMPSELESIKLFEVWDSKFSANSYQKIIAFSWHSSHQFHFSIKN